MVEPRDPMATVTTQQLQNYLRQLLGIEADLCVWEKSPSLPLFLIEAHLFWRGSILGHRCLFIVPRQHMRLETLKIHLKQIEDFWSEFCIYVFPTLSPHLRQALIAHHIPFVVPGACLYLPELGLALRDRFKMRRAPVQHCSPTTQAVVIYVLLNPGERDFQPTSLAKILGYSKMTIGRSFDELEALGIAQMQKKGRERLWRVEDRRALWTQAMPYLRTPVRKTVAVSKPIGIPSGLSALANYTMLSPPSIPIYALDAREWPVHCDIEVAPEVGIAELELWSYDPKLFANEKGVDPLSLYLSLAQSEDERVQICLDELESSFPW